MISKRYFKTKDEVDVTFGTTTVGPVEAVKRHALPAAAEAARVDLDFENAINCAARSASWAPPK
jgi:hypothetical protein